MGLKAECERNLEDGEELPPKTSLPTISEDGHQGPETHDIGVDKAVEYVLNIIIDGASSGGTLSWLEVVSQEYEHTDGIGAAQCIELLEANHPEKTGRPFFIAMGFYRPHTPYVAPHTYFDMYPKSLINPYIMPEDDRDDIPKAALQDRPGQLELGVEIRKEIIQASIDTGAFNKFILSDRMMSQSLIDICLLYTSDAADE